MRYFSRPSLKFLLRSAAMAWLMACALGSALTPASTEAQSISATFLERGHGPAGAWGVFSKDGINDVYSLSFSYEGSASIDSITLTGPAQTRWSTDAEDSYPIVVKSTAGEQLNGAYHQTFGPFMPGVVHELRLYAFVGGFFPTYFGNSITVKFSDGAEVSAVVAAPDVDYDGLPDFIDVCPTDRFKRLDKGLCGCGKPETDTDGDEIPDCIDKCPTDPAKGEPGMCGCAIQDSDSNKNQVVDCTELRTLRAPQVIVRGLTANVIVPVQGFNGYEITIVQHVGGTAKAKRFTKSGGVGNNASFKLTPGQWSARYKIRSHIAAYAQVVSNARNFRVRSVPVAKKHRKAKKTKHS